MKNLPQRSIFYQYKNASQEWYRHKNAIYESLPQRPTFMASLV